MATKIKKKLCWNCEGRVGFEEEHCPFCGVYLSPAYSCGREDEYVEEDVANSPYDFEEEEEEEEEGDLPPPPYGDGEGEGGEKRGKGDLQSSTEELRLVLTPLALLLSGSIFFLFSLLLFLFSKDGEFTIRWSGEYWYFYLAASVVLLFFGWRQLQFVDD